MAVPVMHSVPHLVPNGFTIQNLGVDPVRFYQPCNQSLSVSPRGWCKPCSQNLGVSYHVFSSPCQRQCELLPSLGVRRPASVNVSHFYLIL